MSAVFCCLWPDFGLHKGANGWTERVRLKSTIHFVELLNEYINSLPNRIFSPKDAAFGRFTADREWIEARFRAYGKFPIKKRLSMVADDMFHRFQTEQLWQDEPPSARAILRSLTAMLTMKSTLALYKDFYKAIGKPRMLVQPQRKTLEWMDVFPFLYLHFAFEGLKGSVLTRHLVIDEMQDYTPIQFTVLNLLFPCQKTILGDFGQSLNPYHAHTLADLRRLYDGAEFMELNKSYRSTFEIMTFAKSIQNISALDAIKRHGDEPVLIACESAQDEIQQVKKAIHDFEAGENASLGIVLKTNAAARALFDLLSGEFTLNLISPDSTRFTGGGSVTSIQMAKGLEFDEVLLPQADSRTYYSDHDRGLLYIACTRAMHRLTLLYTGEPSRFIPRKERH